MVTSREQLVAATTLDEHRRDVAGIPTAVLEGGHGPPILFLQGEFGPLWLRVTPHLVADHRVVAPDLPGLGESELPAGSFDADTVLSWLDVLIAQTCQEPPVVVGKAIGGAIAARYATRHPDRLRGLVLVDSWGLAPFRPRLGMALSFLSVLVRRNEPSVNRSFREYCFVDLDGVQAEMGDTWEHLFAYALQGFRTPRVRKATMRLSRAFGSAIPADELAGIATPTTLIWGRHDVGVPLDVAESGSETHGWPLHVIEQARDDPALEQPDAFLAALRSAIALSERGTAT